MKPTMTLQDVRMDLRARGFRISPAMISQNIKSGLFPFGKVINVGDTGRTTILILRNDYEKWADEVAPK